MPRNPSSAVLSPLLVLALACTAGLAAGESADRRPPPSAWATTYDYGTSTAHDPQFGNAKLWPHLTGKEYFLKAALPPARVLVWSKPGQSANDKSPLNPLDPANWTDLSTGKPATALPDTETDVIMPASDKYYIVDFQNAGHGAKKWGVPFKARCVTVGANANLYGSDAYTTGHVWVRRGGYFMVDVTHFFEGSRHTFYRNENDRVTKTGPGGDGTYLCQYLKFNKSGKDISAEILGNAHTVDEFQMESGTLIIGPGSVVEPGREANPYLGKNAVLALMDGAYFGKWIIDFHCTDLEVRGGSVFGGLPDRPLTRNAVFKVGRKNFTAAAYDQPVDREGEKIKGRLLQRVPGITLQAGSTVRSFSVDPAKARLVITTLPEEYAITFLRHAAGSEHLAKQLADPAQKAFVEWISALPKGIDLRCGKGVTIDGVEFDGFRKGGLMLEEAGAEKSWKNVFYGPANLGSPAELVGPPYGNTKK